MKQIFKILVACAVCFFSTSYSMAQSTPYNFSWVTGFKGSVLTDIRALASDSSHSMIVGGYTFPSVLVGNQNITFNNRGGFVAKLDSARNVLWYKSIPISNDQTSSAVQSIVTDDHDNIYVYGNHRIQNAQADTVLFDTLLYNFTRPPGFQTSNAHIGYVLKMNPAGDVLWVKACPGSNNNLGHLVYKSGKVYFTFLYSAVSSSQVNNVPSFYTEFDGIPLVTNSSANQIGATAIVKMDTSGSVDWINNITLEASSTFGNTARGPGDLHIDNNHNIYLPIQGFPGTFSYNGTQVLTPSLSSSRLGFVAKIDSSGTLLYSHFIDNQHDNQEDFKITVINNSVYLYGMTNQSYSVTPSITVNNHYILKYDHALNPVASYQLPASYNDVTIRGMLPAKDSNLIIYGGLRGSLSFPSNSINGNQMPLVFRTDTTLSDADFNLAGSSGSSITSQGWFNDMVEYFDDSYLGAGRCNGNTNFGNVFFSSSQQNNGIISRIIPCQSLKPTAVQDTVVICSQGASVTLEALGNSALTYRWLQGNQEIGGATNQTFTTNNTGNYRFYVDSLGCRDTSGVIHVIQGTEPNVSVTPANQLVCQTDSPFVLSGVTPPGGIWTGPGVVNDSVFYPDTAGPGAHTLQYTFEDSLGCIGNGMRTVNITLPPSVTILPLPDYCSSGSPVNFSSFGIPQGGVFSGNGITAGTIFNPQVAGVGSHTLYYTFTDALGCENTDSTQINVNPSPNAFINPIPPVCENTFSIPLTGASPTGGSWSGSHVIGNLFYPLLAGPGTYQVTYTVNQNGCMTCPKIGLHKKV